MELGIEPSLLVTQSSVFCLSTLKAELLPAGAVWVEEFRLMGDWKRPSAQSLLAVLLREYQFKGPLRLVYPNAPTGTFVSQGKELVP